MPAENPEGKILLGNFVEERRVTELKLDSTEGAPAGMSKGQYFLQGHKGLLTTDWQDPLSDITLVRETYVPLKPWPDTCTGIRKDWKEKLLASKVIASMKDDIEPPVPQVEYKTQYGISHNIEGFVSEEKPSTRPHNYVIEDGVSYWSEHKDKVAGMSQFKSKASPFRKNASFTTPVDQSWESPQPYELSRLPNM